MDAFHVALPLQHIVIRNYINTLSLSVSQTFVNYISYCVVHSMQHTLLVCVTRNEMTINVQLNIVSSDGPISSIMILMMSVKLNDEVLILIIEILINIKQLFI